ncbi:MAG: glycosyltransferase family 39 protein [Byssovorax sp.]
MPPPAPSPERALPPFPPAALGLAAAALPLHLALALATDLSPDEAYYLCAARHAGALSGIPDHPPLTLWLLRLSDGLPGPIELRVRIWPILLSFATTLAWTDLARRRGAGPNGCLLAAALASFALLPTAGGFLMTPDGPALLAIALALLLVTEPLTVPRAALAGLALAVGALAKVVLLPIALLLAFTARPATRSPAPRLLLLLPPAAALPLLLPSLRFQLHHAFAQQAPAGWTFLGALGALGAALGAQALLWSPPVLWLGGRALPRLPRADQALLAGLTLLVVASALLRAVPPEPNWWAPAALVLVVAAAIAADSAPRARYAILALALLPTLPAAAHTAHPCLPLPLRADPTARLHGWSRGAEPLAAPGIGPYGPAAERCAYRGNCEEIIKYFDEIDSYSKGSTSSLLQGPAGVFRP